MAYGKYKMSVRNPSTPKPGSDSGDGRMYTGGTPDFDERTGLYRPGSPNEYLNPKPRKPKPGKGDGRKTIMPVPPKGEKRPIRKPIKPINKPGVNPTKKKTGPRPSNRNDIIRNMIKPDGTRVLRTSGRILPGKSKSRGGK